MRGSKVEYVGKCCSLPLVVLPSPKSYLARAPQVTAAGGAPHTQRLPEMHGALEPPRNVPKEEKRTRSQPRGLAIAMQQQHYG